MYAMLQHQHMPTCVQTTSRKLLAPTVRGTEAGGSVAVPSKSLEAIATGHLHAVVLDATQKEHCTQDWICITAAVPVVASALCVLGSGL